MMCCDFHQEGGHLDYACKNNDPRAQPAPGSYPFPGLSIKDIEERRKKLKDQLVALDSEEVLNQWAQDELTKYSDDQRLQLLKTLQQSNQRTANIATAENVTK